MAKKKNRIIVALDGLNTREALALAEKLSGKVWGFKVHSLVDRCGTPVIQVLKQYGNVFADPKIYDVPSKAAERIKPYADAGADFISIHAQGGSRMMQEAVRSARASVVLAVTVLTSYDQGECIEFFGLTILQKSLQLAVYARDAGCRGVVCSGEELPVLNRKENGVRNLLKVVPAIRPTWYEGEDTEQRRTVIPKEAIRNGADFIVVGRPVTCAKDPLRALINIEKEIS